MSFDIFVQSCITLKRMTDVFKRYDEDRDGYVTFAFEEFLTGKCIRYMFRPMESVRIVKADQEAEMLHHH